MTVYYFGSWNQNTAGPFVYSPDGVKGHPQDGKSPPFCGSPILDGGFLPPRKGLKEQVEGKIHRASLAGWTILAFWDRSAEDRPGSNSAFLAEGDVPTADILEVARKDYPALFKRFTFQLEE